MAPPGDEHEAHGFAFVDGRARRLAEQVDRHPLVTTSASTTTARRHARGQLALSAGRAASAARSRGTSSRGSRWRPVMRAEVNTLGAPNDELSEAARPRARSSRDPSSLGYSVSAACFVGESWTTSTRASAALAMRGMGRRSCGARGSGATAGSSARWTSLQSGSSCGGRRHLGLPPAPNSALRDAACSHRPLPLVRQRLAPATTE
jgi:hypothetical protein